MPERQDEFSSSDNPNGRLTNAESFPLLFNQRYQTGRSGSTVTAHSLLSTVTPKSEAELRKHKIGRIIFLTFLIMSATFLIFFPPLYNHFMNPGKVKKAYEASHRNMYLDELKCRCERKKNDRQIPKEVSLSIRTKYDTYKIPLTLEGTTCSPILRSNVSECAEWGRNNSASSACKYKKVLGTVASIFPDIKHGME
ncbi:unnamed protein product [Allacma fusca]|uniref:Uncharacterized protein n=1 Tax=Allacma fusca TaxID=39272 RepID=A0A8J2L8G6_9HEXA|nr:unnamed protein product [Allacma fusca]